MAEKTYEVYAKRCSCFCMTVIEKRNYQILLIV